MPAEEKLIYKIVGQHEWLMAEAEGYFIGSAVDIDDGFIHFSAREQVRETAERYFAGRSGLLLVGVSSDDLGEALKWEASRGGMLFPHLYSVLPLAAVRSVDPLPCDEEGRHVFPSRFCADEGNE